MGIREGCPRKEMPREDEDKVSQEMRRDGDEARQGQGKTETRQDGDKASWRQGKLETRQAGDEARQR